MKRFWIGLGAFAAFVVGVGFVAYGTGLLVSEANVIDLSKSIEGPGGITGIPDQTSTVFTTPGSSTQTGAPTEAGAGASGGSGGGSSNSANCGSGGTIEACPVEFKETFFSENFADLNTILTVGVPQLLINFSGLVFLIMLLIYGQKFLWNAGNEQGTAEAKQGLLFAGIGFAITILAYAIVFFASQIFK
ncbi:MAG: hypothetical protein AAB701_01795 [Patescibacteria group bacterium]